MNCRIKCLANKILVWKICTFNQQGINSLKNLQIQQVVKFKGQFLNIIGKIQPGRQTH